MLAGTALIVGAVGLFVGVAWPDTSGSTRAGRMLNRAGVDAHPDDTYWRAETDRLRKADPASDAERAIAESDFRVLGLWGDGVYFPGLEGRPDLYGRHGLVQTLGANMFEKTSDAIVNDTQSRYINVATTYAEAYNTHLVSELDRLGKLDSPNP